MRDLSWSIVFISASAGPDTPIAAPVRRNSRRFMVLGPRQGTRLHCGLLREEVSFGATADLVLSSATCTRAPSRRSSAGLITTTLPTASPPVTSTQLPRSRPTVTVWYRTVESGATVTTCGGPSRITSAVAGRRSGGVPGPSASCPRAYHPGRDPPPGFAPPTPLGSGRAGATGEPAGRATGASTAAPA